MKPLAGQIEVLRKKNVKNLYFTKRTAFWVQIMKEPLTGLTRMIWDSTEC